MLGNKCYYKSEAVRKLLDKQLKKNMEDRKVMIPDNGIITRDTPEYRILQDMLRHVERIADTLMTEVAPALSGERYLTTEQVMSQLHISRRALQTYRDKGLIPYTSLGKVLLYPESKINEVLERNYYDPMR